MPNASDDQSALTEASVPTLDEARRNRAERASADAQAPPRPVMPARRRGRTVAETTGSPGDLDADALIAKIAVQEREQAIELGHDLDDVDEVVALLDSQHTTRSSRVEPGPRRGSADFAAATLTASARFNRISRLASGRRIGQRRPRVLVLLAVMVLVIALAVLASAGTPNRTVRSSATTRTTSSEPRGISVTAGAVEQFGAGVGQAFATHRDDVLKQRARQIKERNRAKQEEKLRAAKARRVAAAAKNKASSQSSGANAPSSSSPPPSTSDVGSSDGGSSQTSSSVVSPSAGHSSSSSSSTVHSLGGIVGNSCSPQC